MISHQSDTKALRQSIIDACLSMNQLGLNQGTSGNISARCGERMLITPSGIAYETLTPEMLLSLPLAGGLDVPFPGESQPALRPSSEWRFHKALLQNHADMGFVVHAHPAYATALAMIRKPIPASHYMIAAFGGDSLRVADYAIFGSKTLAENVVRASANRHGCLMANHGALVLGETLARGLWRLGELEVLAKSYTLAQMLGTPAILSAAEIEEALQAFADYGLKDS
uniref:class II aldolase/adducin family protein n=1 Tax=Pararhizobium sp. IMCC3301 TaxID=3067904 RepID=UPI0027410A35|nr:class II aldolase/adducin family protein [Pararhizobium sp. IMCC3301]